MTNSCVRFLLIAFMFLSARQNTPAQGLSNIFLFGYFNGGGNIDFSSGMPIVSADSMIVKLNLTNANITDSFGNLLFYSNGVVICNATHDTMQNGGGLNPSFYTNSWANDGLRIPQGNIIIPVPGSDSLYYLLHETVDLMNPYRPDKLYYSLIDISQSGGLGTVALKNVILFNDTLAGGQLTACKHANGRDWWLAVPEYGNPSYYFYIITPSGIFYNSKQTIGVRIAEAQAAFSPDGNRYGYYDSLDDIEIFDFDRCSGLLSNPRHVAINDSNFGYGFSFSPNSQLAYASSAHYLYQVDATVANPSVTLDTVAVWDSTYSPFPPIETGFFLQQLAPDNKLYIATTGSTYYFHYINYPDSVGSACDVKQHSISIPVTNNGTIPNHPNYFLGALAGSPCDSLTSINDHLPKPNFSLRINPNPAQQMFYVNYQLPHNENAVMYIYNAMGEEVMRKALYWYFGYLQVDASGLSNGVYMIKVEAKSGRAGAKLVIAR